jgi:DNA-binding transcriptional regulator YhcF (GntR family)
MTQAAQIGMEVDAMDAIVRDREQERREWRASFVEDKRGLAIELVHFGFQVRAAGCRRHERGNPPCPMQRLLKIANSSGAPAFRASIRDHHGILRQHGNERVNVARGRGLCERCEQALMSFRGSGKQTLVLRDVLSRAFKKLSTRGLILANQRGNVFVIEIENVPEQQYRAFSRSQTLKHHEKRHRDVIEHLDATDTSCIKIKWLRQSVTSILFTACPR